VFGTPVDTVDLTAAMEAYRTGKARGYLGEAAFSDDDERMLCHFLGVEFVTPTR
jgi:hypothetical protein